MQLGLVEALVVPADDIERLAENLEPLLRLPDPAVGFRNQGKKGWLPKTGAGGPQIGQTLAHLGASFFAAALLDQAPAPQDRSHRHPYRKTLFGTERDSRLGVPARGLRLAS